MHEERVKFEKLRQDILREKQESLISEQLSERKQYATAVETERQNQKQQKLLRDDKIRKNREALD